MSKPNIRVTVERPMAESDVEQETPRWSYVTNIWINITPLTGREREQAAQMQSTTTHMGISDWFAGARSGMRLRDCERIWNVSSVVNVGERNRKLEWRLTELESGGY